MPVVAIIIPLACDCFSNQKDLVELMKVRPYIQEALMDQVVHGKKEWRFGKDSEALFIWELVTDNNGSMLRTVLN